MFSALCSVFFHLHCIVESVEVYFGINLSTLLFRKPYEAVHSSVHIEMKPRRIIL